jgi:hypothetical protein
LPEVHALTELQPLQDASPGQAFEQQQQPAMEPQPVLAPQLPVVKISQKNWGGVAVAHAVGAAIERIIGAATAAAPI